jgi:hypothetical protein
LALSALPQPSHLCLFKYGGLALSALPQPSHVNDSLPFLVLFQAIESTSKKTSQFLWILLSSCKMASD